MISFDQLDPTSLVRALTILLVGFVASRVGGAVVERVTRSLPGERAVLARRATVYAIGLIAVAEALRELGFDLSVLLGAAGIFSVAIGFASQTSASNLISGLFLVVERPFSVGDSVRIGNTLGEVVAIDLLSTKLRTFDNLFVRVPNETVMKSEIQNLSRFPIRRFEFELVLAWDQNAKEVEAILQTVASSDVLVLDEPAPRLDFVAVETGGARWSWRVWTSKEQFVVARNRLASSMVSALESQGVRLAAPTQRVQLESPEAPHERA